MYELMQVGADTFYINSPSKMGIYRMGEKEVCLIDSGNDKDAGKKVLKILEEQEWRLKMIINTHSHADHVGGNNFLQQRLGVPAYGVGMDNAFIANPFLEPSYLFGGSPVKELKNKFLMAQPSEIQELTEDILPDGMEMIRLDGHSFSMIGLKTRDEVWFLADSLTSVQVLEKYHVSFLQDVGKYLESLERVEKLEGKLFIPSHAEPSESIKSLVEANRDKVAEIIELLNLFCEKPISFEDILQHVFDHYALTMNFTQYVLLGSTIRSYLSYLHDRGEVTTLFEQNKLFWQRR